VIFVRDGGMSLHLIVIVTVIFLICIGSKRKINPWIYILMVLITAYNTDNSDRYFNEWTFYGKYRAKEPLYAASIKFFRDVAGFDYQQYYALIMCACIVLLLLFVCRYTRHTTFFGVLYAIYPMPLMISGIRATIAGMIVLNSIHLLRTKKLKDMILYVFLILLATSFHFSAFIFLILLIADTNFNDHSILALSGLLVLSGFLLIFTDLFNKLIPAFIIEGGGGKWFEGKNLNGFIVATIFHIFFYFVFLLFYLKLGSCKELKIKNSFLSENMKLFGRINSVSVLFIVLYVFNYLFFGRLYMTIEEISRIVMIEALETKGVRWRDNEKPLYWIILMIATAVFAINVSGMAYFGYIRNFANNPLLGG